MEFLKIHQFLSLVFTARSMGVYLPDAVTLGCAVWPGAGISYSQGISPNFYAPHVNVGPPVPILLPLHATLNLLASPPTLPTQLYECGSPKSLVVGLPYSLIFCQFWGLFWGFIVILSVVVWGGKVWLPILTRSQYFFPDISPWARETKEKNKQMRLHQTKMFLHSKGNHQ